MVSKGFPNVTTSGRQYNFGEKLSVILYTYINLHAGYFFDATVTVGACINDVRKIKIGKNQNQNWVLIGRGSKPPDYANLFFGNRCQTKEVPRDLMFIFRKINIGGVHLIEGFPNATRQRPEHTAGLQQQDVDRLHRHTIHTTSAGMAHANGPTARATVNSTSWWWGQEQRVVLDFVDADTTQKATGATSAQIDFVCVICTSNSSTAAVASLSLPLSLCVFVLGYLTTISPFIYLPFYFFAATTKCLYKRHLFPTTSAQI